MVEEEEKEEIAVKAPSKSVISPEKKTERALEKALEEERFGTLLFSKKIGSYFGFSIVFTGIILLAFLAYICVTGQMSWIASSAAVSPALAFWVFLGIINVIAGFLLIGSQE